MNEIIIKSCISYEFIALNNSVIYIKTCHNSRPSLTYTVRREFQMSSNKMFIDNTNRGAVRHFGVDERCVRWWNQLLQEFHQTPGCSRTETGRICCRPYYKKTLKHLFHSNKLMDFQLLQKLFKQR